MIGHKERGPNKTSPSPIEFSVRFLQQLFCCSSSEILFKLLVRGQVGNYPSGSCKETIFFQQPTVESYLNKDCEMPSFCPTRCLQRTKAILRKTHFRVYFIGM